MVVHGVREVAARTTFFPSRTCWRMANGRPSTHMFRCTPWDDVGDAALGEGSRFPGRCPRGRPRGRISRAAFCASTPHGSCISSGSRIHVQNHRWAGPSPGESGQHHPCPNAPAWSGERGGEVEGLPGELPPRCRRRIGDTARGVDDEIPRARASRNTALRGRRFRDPTRGPHQWSSHMSQTIRAVCLDPIGRSSRPRGR